MDLSAVRIQPAMQFYACCSANSYFEAAIYMTGNECNPAKSSFRPLELHALNGIAHETLIDCISVSRRFTCQWLALLILAAPRIDRIFGNCDVVNLRR